MPVRHRLTREVPNPCVALKRADCFKRGELSRSLLSSAARHRPLSGSAFSANAGAAVRSWLFVRYKIPRLSRRCGWTEAAQNGAESPFARRSERKVRLAVPFRQKRARLVQNQPRSSGQAASLRTTTTLRSPVGGGGRGEPTRALRRRDLAEASPPGRRYPRPRPTRSMCKSGRGGVFSAVHPILRRPADGVVDATASPTYKLVIRKGG